MSRNSKAFRIKVYTNAMQEEGKNLGASQLKIPKMAMESGSLRFPSLQSHGGSPSGQPITDTGGSLVLSKWRIQ